MKILDGKKKLLALLLTIVVQTLGTAVGLDPATSDKVSAALVAYILGQGIADVGKYRK